MKSKKPALISLTLLAILLAGAVLVLSIGGDTLQATQVKFIPKVMDINNMGIVTAEIKLEDETGVHIEDQIDPDTVLLEGAMIPLTTRVELLPNGKPILFVAEFDGNTLRNYVISKIIHMGITRPHPWNPINVHLRVTGELCDEYGGTPWEGDGTVMISFGDVVPPPPPPP